MTKKDVLHLLVVLAIIGLDVFLNIFEIDILIVIALMAYGIWHGYFRERTNEELIRTNSRNWWR